MVTCVLRGMRGERGTSTSGGHGKKAAGPGGVAHEVDMRLGLKCPMFSFKAS